MIILDDNHFYVIDPLETLTRLFQILNLRMLFRKLVDFNKRKDKRMSEFLSYLEISC